MLQAELTNWSKSACSQCFTYKASNISEIRRGLELARAQHLSVIPHGAGHSYTDAALNTSGVVIDVTPMRRILSWDPVRGIMRVEPGVTLREMVQMAWQDGWWPYVAPSTPAVTIGGCAAMNVNGKNAWKYGPFGGHILSMDVLLTSGEICTLEPDRDPQLFHAFVGSLGLLGILTSITVQLQRIYSGYVTIHRRSAASLAEIFELFAEEEPRSDYMEAWLDGLAEGEQFGRGMITCARLIEAGNAAPRPFSTPAKLARLETSLFSIAGRLGRPVLQPGVQFVNHAIYQWGRWGPKTDRRQALPRFTFWPSAAFGGYHSMFPQGAETFHAFVPGQHAKDIFEGVLRYSQQQNCFPIWCIIKLHRHDPFLLTYQVDGFSLELNYQRTPQMAHELKQVLQHMIAIVVEGGGRFYLAKDHFLTHDQYRRSVGGEVVDTFLELKQRYDPEMLLQSDLFRRIFLPDQR